MKNILFTMAIFFLVTILSQCKKDDEAKDNNNNNINPAPTYQYYINYNDTAYQLDKAIIRVYPYLVPPAHYLEFYMVSPNVVYDTFLEEMSGEGTGIKMMLSTPQNVNTLPVGEFSIGSKDTTINSCHLYINTDFFMPEDGIGFTEGTLKVQKNNSTYTINITGKDANNKTIVVYYSGTVMSY